MGHMAIKKTTQVGNPIIRAKAKKVADTTSKETKKIIKNLTDSMRKRELVGMAAPQIGESARIFVTEIRKTKHKRKGKDELRVFINPEITFKSKKKVNGWEGCGSVSCAGLFGVVSRHETVTVEAVNENSEKFELKTSGLLAILIQHETDHLNGIVFTDKADRKTFMSAEEYLK